MLPLSPAAVAVRLVVVVNGVKYAPLVLISTLYSVPAGLPSAFHATEIVVLDTAVVDRLIAGAASVIVEPIAV